MDVRCAGEIMLPLEAFPHIPYWFTFRQALAELADVEAPGDSARHTPWVVLVFNAQNQVLGIVQRQDILRSLRLGMQERIRGIYPSYPSEPVDPDLRRFGFSSDNAVRELQNQIERQIVEFMTPIQVTIDFHDSALFAVYVMIDHGLVFVPVVRAGQIVGLVYVEDALQEVISNII